MKQTLALVLIVALSISQLSAQQAEKSNISKLSAVKTTLSVVYSFGGNDLFTSPGRKGGPSYAGKGFYGFGALASMEVAKNLDLVTGFTYVGNRFEMTAAPIGIPLPSVKENINLFSIPLMVKYHFFKYMFVSGGPVFSANTGDRDLNGIGATGSFGVEYIFKNGLVLSFGPFLKYHGLLPWKDYKLTNSGFNLGIGYRL